MNRSIPLVYLLYTAVAGLLLGLALAGTGLGRSGTPIEPMASMDHDLHMHLPFDIGDAPVPTLRLEAEPDLENGWNLTLVTENFTLRPALIDAEPSANAGHAHLYVNGEKYARLYGPHFHIAGLSEGRNDILVTLNTDDHQALYHEGQAIEATATLAYDP